jgi:hypothetical protein
MTSNGNQSTQLGSLALLAAAMILHAGCGSSNDTTTTRGDGAGVGGQSSIGGSTSTSGSAATGGAAATGSASTMGGAATTGGVASAGGSKTTGGATAAGGSKGTGGAAATGGAKSTGGAAATGGGANCVAAATPSSATMNPGQGCTTCHSGASPAMGVLITLGGTLYSASTSGSAVSGATVTLTDNNNTVTKLITGPDGNFYTGSTIAFPAKVSVSKCPDTATMVSTVTSGNCNSCHGSSMQIHLP